MSLESRQAVAARLLLDPDYCERFFSPAATPGEHGLDPDEFVLLRRIDASKVAACAEGYAWKAWERLVSIFPRTLEALEQTDPSWLRAFIESAPMASDEATERAAFLDRLRRDAASWAAERQRLVEDVADLELLLRLAPAPAPLSGRRLEDMAPRPACILLLAARGPLDEALPDLPRFPRAYPACPSLFLVARRGEEIRLFPAGPEDLLILAACDGTRSIREIEREFPQVASCARRLAEWLRWGLLADAMQANAGASRSPPGKG